MSASAFAGLETETTMIPGGRYLAQAKELLADQKVPTRSRLHQAGLLFWRAYATHELWPRDLREQADSVIHELLALGPIGQTVAAMDDKQVQRVCGDLSHFIRYCQRFDERHAA